MACKRILVCSSVRFERFQNRYVIDAANRCGMVSTDRTMTSPMWQLDETVNMHEWRDLCQLRQNRPFVTDMNRQFEEIVTYPDGLTQPVLNTWRRHGRWRRRLRFCVTDLLSIADAWKLERKKLTTRARRPNILALNRNKPRRWSAIQQAPIYTCVFV